jgi:hypothetical protein
LGSKGAQVEANMRRGPKTKIAAAPCPDSLHAGSNVISHGSRTIPAGTRRRFICRPVNGEVHTFTIITGVAEPYATWSPPPVCSTHPGGKVVRSGTYRRGAKSPRQRYRCWPDPSDKTTSHTFTPALPREHVHLGDEHCDDCGEVRGIHHGETAVARRHRWSTKSVARGLYDLSMGKSYASVSRWAKRENGELPNPVVAPVVVGGGKSKKPKNMRSAQSHNVWHIAADWTEVFAPVLWRELDARLRTEALAERERLDALAGSKKPLDHPQVWLIDEVPVSTNKHIQATGKYERSLRFYVLVVAEVVWSGDPTDPYQVGRELRLRLARTMPKANQPAWRLVFDEMGYTPDFIVGDAAPGLTRAVQTHFGSSTRFVPSVWHLTQRIQITLLKVPAATQAGPAGKALVPELAAHLHLLKRNGVPFQSRRSWTKWWNDLHKLLAKLNLPVESVAVLRSNYEDAMNAILPDLRRYPQVPVSTGGLETVMNNYIQPVLEGRRSWLGNIERTNRLFDLVVCRQNGMFDNLADVAQLLRGDATAFDGWAPPVREVADRRDASGKYYSSLTDPTMLVELAKQAGVA